MSNHSGGLEDDLGHNAHFDSNELSEASHNATKKNLFLQENIITNEEGIASLEEVREFDEESDSKPDSERKDSHNSLQA